jgi:hypothetical protein
MKGDDVRRIFEAVFPREEIERWASELGIKKRDRKLDVMALVRAMVISAGTPNGGIQADALRAYLEYEVKPIGRSGFYQWFDPPLEHLMARLSERALDFGREQKVDLPGPLSGVTDWRIVDSETVKTRGELLEEFPGAGKYAAIKVHKTLSLGTGCVVSYHFSPAKEHDSPHLTIDESWAGYGLLADLGYASFDRLRACQKHGVSFILRLKDNWKPRVERIDQGTTASTFCAGTDLDLLLEGEVLLLDGSIIDAEVVLGPTGDLRLRLVGIPTPKGYCFFLTNLPKRVDALQVGDIYRVRWEVELSMKLDKSVNRLDESDAERPCSLKALLHASLISSVLTALIVHKQTLATRPRKEGGTRTQPPLHPMLVGRYLGIAAPRIALLLDNEDPWEAKDGWQRVADHILHMGSDPNWRRRPSILDQMRGWKLRPPAKKSAKARPLAGRMA